MSILLRLCVVTVLLLPCACVDLTGVGNPYANRGVTIPAPVSTTVSFTNISAGFFHSCAIDVNGAAWCWGSNEYLQLGSSATQPVCEVRVCLRTPVRVEGAFTFSAIGTGTTHTCALTTGSRVVCWGGGYPNSPSLLGDDLPSSSATPVLVASDSLFVQLTVGTTHSCALTASGQAFCWGQNFLGQLGDGTRVNRARPVAVATTSRFVHLSAGGTHTCGVTTSASVLCWGSNRWGQLGIADVPYNNFGVSEATPVRVPGTQRWMAIGAGGDHTCALVENGTAWCWGENNAQQLGDGLSASHRGVPVQVQGGHTFTSIALGTVASCGQESSGKVWCWGSNYFGALGNGRMVDGGEPTPVNVRGGPWQQVSIGGSHSCGINLQGISFCWGDGFYGQTGSAAH